MSLDVLSRRMYDQMKMMKSTGENVLPTGFEVLPDQLRLAMRQWVTGVTIVTSQYQDVRHGMTVNSFTSVALTPPLVLVSLEQITRTHKLVQESGIFGVTILSERQRELSERFAGRNSEYEDRFAGVKLFTLATGAPLLVDGLASFDCKVVAAYPAGTHTLFIGDVIAAQINQDDLLPLIYYNRDYHSIK